ncbi:EamA family transporter [Priestia aryabhattai]|uniref:EamA family transporter n=1 Tax=Priestia TaxID=2800373 RepID=UPI001C231B0F|nr:EamA family transporter [Priestia megaterium]MBU8687918.1 EamA family transporter [Priestia megaterium]MCL9637162.1 EamA family transporter [Bacillus zanthoxyli]
MSFINFLLILVNTLTLVSGQFLWKFGLESNKNPFQSFYSLISLFLSPYVLSGLFLYGLATILWLFILTRVPLSVAYPIQSLAYILAIVGAYFVFGESITLYKVLGCIFIMIGVSFIGLTSSQ